MENITVWRKTQPTSIPPSAKPNVCEKPFMLSRELQRFCRAGVGGGIIPETRDGVYRTAASRRGFAATEGRMDSADRPPCWHGGRWCGLRRWNWLETAAGITAGGVRQPVVGSSVTYSLE
jgi:hypothetical protein